MNKILLTFLASAVMVIPAGAQQKIMRIHHSDGTSETRKVNDVVKITFENEGETPQPEGPQMVDMGLSVKWASYNIGATSPEDYGNF